MSRQKKVNILIQKREEKNDLTLTTKQKTATNKIEEGTTKNMYNKLGGIECSCMQIDICKVVGGERKSYSHTNNIHTHTETQTQFVRKYHII